MYERQQLRYLLSDRRPAEPAPHGHRVLHGMADRTDWVRCRGCGKEMQPAGLCITHGLCGWCHEDDGITPRPRRARGLA